LRYLLPNLNFPEISSLGC